MTEKTEQKKFVQLALTVGILLTVALVGLALVVSLGFALRWYLSPQTDLSIIQRQALVQGLASVAQAGAVGLTGAAGFIGLLFTWRNLAQTRESTRRTLELTEQGQITERFTRAIDQLGATDDEGAKKLEIRLGGIYALERIDKESHGRAYHGTVMEVLTAYVRENSRWEHEELSTSTTASNEGVEQDNGVAQDKEPPLQRLPADIQAILDVLKRREEERVPKEHRVLLDLRGAFLQEASLQEANLKKANLQGANLQDTNLRVADLQEADLRNAFLRVYPLGMTEIEAWLVGANLEGANLEGADLQGVDLQHAILQNARGMTQKQIDRAIGNENIKLPEGLIRPKEWSMSRDEHQIPYFRSRAVQWYSREPSLEVYSREASDT